MAGVRPLKPLRRGDQTKVMTAAQWRQLGEVPWTRFTSVKRVGDRVWRSKCGDGTYRMDVWRCQFPWGEGLPCLSAILTSLLSTEPAPTSYPPLGRFVNQCSAMSKRLSSVISPVVAQKAATLLRRALLSRKVRDHIRKRALDDGSKGKQVAQSPEPRRRESITGASGALARPPVASGMGSSAQRTLGEALGPQASVMASAATVEKNSGRGDTPGGQGEGLLSSYAAGISPSAPSIKKLLLNLSRWKWFEVQNRAIELEGALAEEKAKGKKLTEDADARDKVIAKLEARISELEKSQSLTQGRIIAAFKESDDFLEAVRDRPPLISVMALTSARGSSRTNILTSASTWRTSRWTMNSSPKRRPKPRKERPKKGQPGRGVGEAVLRIPPFVERQSQRTRSRSHVDGKLNAEWVESAGKWFNGGNGGFYFSKIGTSRDLGRWAGSITTLSCMSTVPFMFSKTNLGGEESKQSLPSWISDHLGAKSYIDETSQSPLFPPIPLNSQRWIPRVLLRRARPEKNLLRGSPSNVKGGRRGSFLPRGRVGVPYGHGRQRYYSTSSQILGNARLVPISFFWFALLWSPNMRFSGKSYNKLPTLSEVDAKRTEAIFGKIEPGGYFEVSKAWVRGPSGNILRLVARRSLPAAETTRPRVMRVSSLLVKIRLNTLESLDGVSEGRLGEPVLLCRLELVPPPWVKKQGKAKAEKATKATTAKLPTKGVVIREKRTREGVPGRAAEAGTSSPGGDVGSESMSDASVAQRLLTGVIPASDKKEVDQLSENELVAKSFHALGQRGRIEAGTEVDDLKATMAELTNKLAKAKELASRTSKPRENSRQRLQILLQHTSVMALSSAEAAPHQFPTSASNVANNGDGPSFADEEEAMKEEKILLQELLYV
ncbi:hypothetical protein Acr_02g0008850 [Actinidia rufa]|uniref:Uncharacterized protein n=1 Tax=Actinidia rufa TaxID=165716 RepID=A0A7J0E8E4_9ERIC|nr:hypothetical protein Acr_02g0008850 [Actinidia rufa]